MIVDGHYIVLKEADHLAAGEDVYLCIWVEGLQGGVIIKDLIQTVVVELVPQTSESVPGYENPD